ncbi:MAG: hypothetical protein HRT36_03140 [Alphaproteobacteria bacterium]|nr:hypothetical protein [Alphaproteobacteria bacterium]
MGGSDLCSLRHGTEANFALSCSKELRREKGVWTLRNVSDVGQEKIPKKTHPHNKSVDLRGELIEAVTSPGELVVDPVAGSFSVLNACRMRSCNLVDRTRLHINPSVFLNRLWTVPKTCCEFGYFLVLCLS